MQHAFTGSGPGAQTRDGCSVELYRQLPYMGELAEVEGELRRHTDVLELGCGSGRLCGRLLELGLQVAGVDESPEMLACMPAGAQRIQSSIERLYEQRTWSAVLLPSQLINHPLASTRTAFVQAARRHLAPGGVFYARRHHPRWLRSVVDGPLGAASGVAMFVENVSRDGDLVSMVLRYEAGANEWTHGFSSIVLDEAQIETLLRQEGFSSVRWLGQERLWVAASVR